MRDADAKAGAGVQLLAAVARQLALRMSYEDVIRVAQTKIDPARLARIVRELDVKAGQTFAITEFLKPRVEEFCSILPSFLARGVLGIAERFPALARAHWGMAINTRSISGYLRSRFSRSCARSAAEPSAFSKNMRRSMLGSSWSRMRRRFRPSLRSKSPNVRASSKAMAIQKRGAGNYRTIAAQVIAPALAGAVPLRQAIDALRVPERQRCWMRKAKPWRNASPAWRRFTPSPPNRSRRTGTKPRRRHWLCGSHLLRVSRHGPRTRAKIRATQNRKPQNCEPQNRKAWVEPPLVGARDARERRARS